MEDVTNTSVKLEKQLLVPGRTYEAQVRARVSVGQWSHWSPAVTWQTKEGESKRGYGTILKLHSNPLTRIFSCTRTSQLQL